MARVHLVTSASPARANKFMPDGFERDDGNLLYLRK